MASAPTELPDENSSGLKRDFLASVVVFLVALPLCMGIAIASGAPVAAGLITGIVGGLVVGTLSGVPLQVSGPAAGLTVIVYDIIQKLGLEMLGLVVLAAGAMQVAAGLLRLGQWFRAVSPAVINGMLAGIGVLIFASQFHVMVDDKPKGNGLQNLMSIPGAISKGLNVSDYHDREVRAERAVMLKAVGELHRRQIQLQERLAEHTERITDDGNSSSLMIDDPAAFAAEQKKLTIDVQSTMKALSDFERNLNEDGRSERVIRAAEDAMRKSLTAEIDLEVDELNNEALAAQTKAVESLEELMSQLSNHSLAGQIGVLTILVIVLWQKFAPKQVKLVPAALVSIIMATAVASLFVLPVLYVEVPDRLWEETHIPTVAVFHNAPWALLLQSAALIAVVASAETLLSATAVDQMHTGPRAKYDKELFAQGVGNVCCGLVGALPMTGVIVRSSANVQAGATTRASAILHGVWLLLFVVALTFVLRMIPTASLAAMLVFTGYKLIDLKSIKKLHQYGWGEVAIYGVTVVMIVATDLLTGVLVGIGLAAVKLLFTISQLNIELQTEDAGRKATLSLDGAATFVRLPKLAAKLDDVAQKTELRIDIEHLDYVDHACLDLIANWARQHESTGGKVIVNWDELQGRFHRDPCRDRSAAERTEAKA